MNKQEKQARQSEKLMRVIEPDELSIEIKPVALNMQRSIITNWELRIFFNHRTQTITQLTNNELREVCQVVNEALDNIQNPDFISATLNFDTPQDEKDEA